MHDVQEALDDDAIIDGGSSCVETKNLSPGVYEMDKSKSTSHIVNGIYIMDPILCEQYSKSP
jgi:hypothetical protein